MWHAAMAVKALPHQMSRLVRSDVAASVDGAMLRARVVERSVTTVMSESFIFASKGRLATLVLEMF